MSVRKFSTASILSPAYKNSKIWDGETFPGYFESIQTVIVPSSGQASVTFSNIPNTYTHLQLRCLYQVNGTDTDFSLRFNTDSGSNYTKHQLYGTGSTTGASASTSQTSIAGGVSQSTTSYFSSAIIDILDYTNTNKYTTVRTLTGSDANGSGSVYLRSGLWLNTAAITSIIIIPTSGATIINQYSHFALYGIRGA